ncbi:MAG: AzlD domain-containing protein [Lachnospiraceae bacterium]|nr:AzlD domain-containing protein [Lachnospiraceae bacterium]
MKTSIFFIYLAIMAGSTYLIRTIPFVAMRKKIENPYVKSFLSYIPYAVLTAMTLPACLYATDYVISAVVGLLTAIFFALKNKSLTVVAMAACIAVFLCETVIGLIA